MLNKRKRRFIKENIKCCNYLKSEFSKIIFKFSKKSEYLKTGSKVLAYAFLSKRNNKKKSISYQTTLCLETGHYKSRINWGKLSRYAFKKRGNEGYFNFLTKF